ncbi:MAG TPA: hypothetical protein VGI44_10980 [Acidimicrobiales bacterium]
MTAKGDDPFREIVAELADGKRWELIRTDQWEEFSERLAGLIVTLPPRRRQALVMLMFALSERMITPDDAQAWASERDLDTEEDLEAMIAWLRQFRPPST